MISCLEKKKIFLTKTKKNCFGIKNLKKKMENQDSIELIQNGKEEEDTFSSFVEFSDDEEDIAEQFKKTETFLKKKV